ncbi:MAG TPA: cyclopropane-fatty-acyl-phospholipid synthase family protein [Candidatus Sulfomarinibacteraceae bacterium]|nr:cyclopropane-fatty-acyl-phospholipid synthase family protein [Candidatus Sulfomarinibacteraceae bacterium]
MSWAVELAERRVLPDPIVRAGMRRLLGRRLRQERRRDLELGGLALHRFVDEMRSSPVAVATDDANRQHYELPAEFFEAVLGPYLKYSSGLWTDDVHDLATAEARMLELTCERAGIADGMEVLDLGCGWGSLSLWIARHHPGCRVLAVSNSRTQAEFIRARCRAEGHRRVEVVTADMNDFATPRRFDRVVSVEMFEHMRSWPRLFERVAGWLEPGGAFLQHVFCHGRFAYHYEDEGAADWMARYFFTGGIMPSADLPRRFPEHLEVVEQWRVSGLHYSRTLDAWLAAMDRERERLTPVFNATYGVDASRWFARWRMFFMACSELFRYRGGSEWFVIHTLMRPRDAR